MSHKSLALISCFLLQISMLSAQEKKSTAADNVKVLSERLKIPGLERDRTIRVYLPPGYDKGDGEYAVLYMHDGQNLFDDATSFVGEWGVDEVMNELSESEGFNLIIVGIDNGGGNRIHELTAWDHEKYGKAEGKEYMNFVVSVVKPYIDTNFRTKPDRVNTGIMGSSLGGLISHYAIYEYPEVFGKAGIFSPSYFWGEGPWQQVEEIDLPKDTRLCLLVGGLEGETMVQPMQDMVKRILERGHPADQITSKVNPQGKHNEKLWNEEFKEAVLWLFKQ